MAHDPTYTLVNTGTLQRAITALKNRRDLCWSIMKQSQPKDQKREMLIETIAADDAAIEELTNDVEKQKGTEG